MRPNHPLQYSHLNSELIERFPELFGGYAELRAMWDGDEAGPHEVYGDLLAPYLTTLLNADGSDISLVRVFDFLEQMAKSEDQAIRDVLGGSVLEAIHPQMLERAKEYMGVHTKDLAGDIRGT
jgi:hypothetical protein